MTAYALAIVLAVGLVAGPQAASPSIADFRWLVGCWASTVPGDDTREHWLSAGPDAMIGVSRTVRSGRLVAHELMLLLGTPSSVTLVARPSGQRETLFPLESLRNSEAVFANPTHDFPQRLIYRLLKDGTLRVRIEGTDAGKARTVDFPLQRAVCE